MATTTSRRQPTTILPLNTQAPHYKWLVASIVLLANGTQTFGGGSGVNIVMPRQMAAFGANLATVQWRECRFTESWRLSNYPQLWGTRPEFAVCIGTAAAELLGLDTISPRRDNRHKHSAKGGWDERRLQGP